MFYAHFVLSKKGPLARIWLAAHWDKKLTKAHVFETNIEGSVEAIIQPKVKLALRTSGHLLLGVVRIYSRKAKYLLADCNEAFVKIKMAFRPGVVDLPEENREAAVSSITLPETFHDFDTTMAELTDLDVQAQFAVNQSRPEEITMREDLGNITLVGDDGFGDMGFDAGPNIIQDAHMDDTLYVRNEDPSTLLLDNTVDKSATDKPMDIDLPDQQRNDNFGDGIADFEEPAGCHDDDDSDNDFGGGVDDDLFGDNFVGEGGGLFEEPPPVPEVPIPEPAKEPLDTSRLALPNTTTDLPPVQEQTTTTIVPDQTTLIPNEAEAFHLEPVDITSLGTERKAKRKRKLVVDDQKGIPSETMKLQLSDTSDITTTLDLAPPTKKLKYWKETGGVEKLFALPGRPMVSKRVTKYFNANLITRPMKETVEDILNLEQEQREEEERLQQQEQQQLQQQQELQKQQQQQQLQQQQQQQQQQLHQQTLLEEADPLPQLDITERELPREGESRLDDPLDAPPAMDELPSMAMDPERPSMAEASLMSLRGAEESLLQQPRTPLTRSRLQHEEPGPLSSDDEDNDDHDDIFGMDLPPAELEPEHDMPDTSDAGADAEEQEEKRWSRRTQQMIHVINKHLKTQSTASFVEMTQRNNRKQVASKFYTLLVLKKMQAIEVEQSSPYGDIAIVPGPKMGLAF